MINIAYIDISFLTVSIMRKKAYEMSLDEVLAKADMMKHELTALHYLSGEILMRQLCLKETGIALKDQRFILNEHGKPALEGAKAWHFNKSHSAQRVVVVTSSSPVGVDVEKISDARMNIADRYYSEEEISMLKACDKEKRDQLFYQLWTAREAYLKFLGTGISYGLENFRIQKHENGTFSVIDPCETNSKLTLFSLPGLYQVAVCGADDQGCMIIPQTPLT